MITTSFKSGSLMFALAAVAGVGAFLMPAAANGQDGWAVSRAEAMEAEAATLSDQKDQWEHAAWLYRSAASLRPTGDVEAVEDLHMAGKLAWYVNDRKQAMEDLEGAAERAMEGGDVFTAANLLVDAAWVASRLGEHQEARRLAAQAETHAGAPVLSDEVRSQVIDRIIDLDELAVVADADDAPGS